ncbi:hypothetical protein [Lentilactobacillus sunkii]|uniref:S-layer protein n=1 Tax=Lentilactobacillus sunkii DSM 19904 TaxID=1423808 RepID=A0A0R1L4E9_9LACO|nr:hypothetical protein [Lentilactobacillus sunkii]KRK87988.1 hypothetical protein FD17_GL000635 [Lentilactobacillus sunkii DSM 19904]
MNKNLKKSLFVSMAALGFLAAAGTVNAQNASAKSYARVTSNQKMTTDPTTRNVTFTGNNALYTKAGTLRGARKVATVTTLNNLASSNTSQKNVRAYRVATTNRGSVYYKVVTFDGNYRGWIYGGKSQADFGGGVDSYTTFNNQSLSTLTQAQQNATYKIASPGTANDGKTVTYKQPAWTQYKVGRAITNSSPYVNTVFKIDQVGTRNREGDQWVHIYDVSNATSPANGWILMSGLTQAEAPVADNAIRINLVDPTNNNNVIKSFDYARTNAQKGSYFGNYTNNVWTITANDQTSILNQARAALNGTSYGLDSLTAAQLAQLGATKFGTSVNIAVNKISTIADNAIRINFIKPDGTSLKTVDWTKNGVAKGSAVGYAVNNSSLWSLNSADQTGIQSAITTALNNSGYQIAGNTLTAAQIDTIARGTFGGQVYINVVPIANNYSTIVPYARVAGGSTSHALTGVNSQYVNGTITVSVPSTTSFISNPNSNQASLSNLSIKLTAAQVEANQGILGTWLSSINGTNATDVKKAAVKSANDQFEALAQSQFNNNALSFNGFTGTAGTSFTSQQVMDYIHGSVLNPLTSPDFPGFNDDGSFASMDNITFTASGADSGTFGTPVKVTYSYPVDD